MNELFNTPFEVSLRILLFLSTDKNNSKSADMITAGDFITTYSGSFGILENNLHGNNPFSFSEFTARREVVHTAIKDLVLKQLIVVEKKAIGFCYKITQNGSDLCNNLNSDYAKEYRFIADAVKTSLRSKSESDVLKMINNSSRSLFKRGDVHG